jgi:hypothetical protein
VQQTETNNNVKAMDVLGQEVVKFMATSGSMKPEDLNRLEDQIRFKLAGSSGLELTAEQIAAKRKEAFRQKKMQVRFS